MLRQTTTSGTDISTTMFKRGRGRPPKDNARATTALVLVPAAKKFLGYTLETHEGDFSVCQKYEECVGIKCNTTTEDTPIRIPESLKETITDMAVREDFLHYAMHIRAELTRHDNNKLHLQKETPDHVYFSYSIDGAPTINFFIHPSRIDVAVSAFENESEHESFHGAVAHQNFSNKAYKKWRDTVRDQFLDDIISFELVKKFGNDTERQEAQKSQRVSMYGHNGAKKIVSPVAQTTSNTPPKQSTPEETYEIIPTSHDEHTVTIEGGQGTIEKDEIPAPPLEMWAPNTTASQYIKTQSPRLPTTDVPAPAEIPEYIEAKKALKIAMESLKPFEGLIGIFRKELQNSDYLKELKIYTTAKDHYEHARSRYVVFILTRHIATMLGIERISFNSKRLASLSSWIVEGQKQFAKTCIGYLLSNERYGHYQQWLERGDRNIDMQLELKNLLNIMTLEGFMMSAFLGATPGLATDSDPSQTIRIASAASTDLSILREELRASFGIEACRVPEMTFIQRRTLDDMEDATHMRNIVTMLEFHARLRGEVLSMERHHTTYCDLYTQLYQKYYNVVTKPAEGVSIQDALGNEKTSIALTESLLRQGKTLNAYAAVKLDGMKFLHLMIKEKYPRSLHDLARVFALKRWENTDMGDCAEEIWEQWHEKGGIEKGGMVYLILEEGETLLGALRRGLFTYEELFSDIEGEGEQKVYTILRQLYNTMDFVDLPSDPKDWLRLGNKGDRVYFDEKGQALYINDSVVEPGFLDAEEFEGFVKGTPEHVLCNMIHDGDGEDFLEYIKDFPEVFLHFYEQKIDVLSAPKRVELQSRLQALGTQDHDSREEAESFFRAFYKRHHGDEVRRDDS
ncbi:MAG: hypothetical protein Q8P11_01695 [bacterium]|nr:hypothetical protein [bacterium]